MSDTLISVVVAIYNVEKYLDRCVNSVLDQTYRALEIILVDDGSTDSCPRICDGYREKDGRVTVIHQKNRGLSGARNAGIDIATGEYIAFIDGDDFIDPETYEVLLAEITSSGCDVAQTGYKHIRENGELRKRRTFRRAVYTKFEDMMDAYFIDENIHVSAWSKLYKRSVFEEIRYVEGLIIEDFEILIKIMHACKKFIVTESAFYNYVLSDNSISRKPMNLLMARSRLEIPLLAYETVKKIDPRFLKYIHDYICKSAIIGYSGAAISKSIAKDQRSTLKKAFVMQYRRYYPEFKREWTRSAPRSRYILFYYLPELSAFAEWTRQLRIRIRRSLKKP